MTLYRIYRGWLLFAIVRMAKIAGRRSVGAVVIRKLLDAAIVRRGLLAAPHRVEDLARAQM